MGEVESKSKIILFLGEFVNSNTKSRYIDQHPTKDFLYRMHRASFSYLRAETSSCSWRFNSKNQMRNFFSALFNSNELPSKKLYEAISAYVGLQEFEQEIIVNWELLYFRGTKA